MSQIQSFEKNFRRLQGRIEGVTSANESQTVDEREKKILTAIENSAIVKLSPNEILTDENLRSRFDRDGSDFLELASSIAQYGILQNLVIAYRREKASYKLVCVAGHRRLAAIEHLGLDIKVPCRIVSESEYKSTKGIALVENLKREGLCFLDVAEGYKDIVDTGEMDIDELAQHFDRHKKTISRYIKVAGWPLEAKKLVRNNEKVFTAKVLIQSFANRKFESDAELLSALKSKLCGNSKSSASGKSQLLETKLGNYFREKQDISDDVREYIIDFLRFAGYAPKGYRYPFKDDADQ